MKKSYPDQIEINDIAKEFIRIRTKLEKRNSVKNQQNFDNYKNYLADKLSHLVMMKANKYKQFPNYPDLVQDGFEALFLALRTYQPKKGDFTWWANKYIKTRISRAANNHSAVKIPLKKAKEMRPHKVKKIPLLIDGTDSSFDIFEMKENNIILKESIEKLSDKEKEVILWAYGFKGNSNTSISFVCRQLKLSRPVAMNLLKAAQEKLREIILSNTNER